MALTIGVTGGIGSGKSSAAAIFGELGAEVIDTDEIAHALTAPGEPALVKIAAELGAHFIDGEGRLNRAMLRAKVFSDPSVRCSLEAILHPRIRSEVARRLALSMAPYCLIVVPLLLETGAYMKVIDRVLVIDCAEQRQVERTAERSRLSEAQVRAIMATQAPREVRLERADDVINNDGGMESLRAQVHALHRKYLWLAKEAGFTSGAH
jgi:dephospho-CoA kinase